MYREAANRTAVTATALAAMLLAGCGGSDIIIGPTPTPTATRTLTPTPTPTPTLPAAAAVEGVVLVAKDVAGKAEDGLVPLDEGQSPPGGFDRALAGADWVLDGGAATGSTSAEGRFEIEALAAGRHTLVLSKTVGGNLVEAVLPIVVGEDGRAMVRVEMGWGLVRTTSTFTEGGERMLAVFAPNHGYSIARSGRVVELGDGVRSVADPDGDGTFDVASCGAACEGTDVCVMDCTPVRLLAVDVFGPERLVVGQEAGASATAWFSGGWAMDVTWLAEWISSAPEVASVDGWGRVTALAPGATALGASLAGMASKPRPLAVVERPPLLGISVQNTSCYYWLGGVADPSVIRPEPPEMGGDILPPPPCTGVVRIGGSLQFAAIGEFADGYWQDITAEAGWRLDPPPIGDLEKGLFTGLQEGSGRVRAALDGIESAPAEVRVVEKPTVVELSIYPIDWGIPLLDSGPPGGTIEPDGMPVPCLACWWEITVLSGDTVRFGATAHYDTGEWEDVTTRVLWRSSDAQVAPIDAAGQFIAGVAGSAEIGAELDDVKSAPIGVRVVTEASVESLHAYQEGLDRAIGKGEEAVFHATAWYDIGFGREVTAEATWRSSDESVGGFDRPGIFTGRAAGWVTVWAEFGGQQSMPLPIEVFEESELAYCNPDDVNRSVWSDNFNRVTLESDCAEYAAGDVVALRFSVTETERPGGIFDPCLDLEARDAGGRLVRVIREEGCGDPFVPFGAPGREDAVLRYQLRASWDLKDEHGAPVGPGTYTIHGRFYLYYDPVVELPIRVVPPK